jgi:GNAT superfamily N-acetyltransferase
MKNLMEPVVHIREANAEDAGPIARLLEQLGYPSTSEEVAARLLRLNDFGSAIVHVAEVHVQPVGVITCHVFPSIHATAPTAWLTTLVVDKQFAGKGIGTALTSSAEGWARSRGASRIVVTSGNHRDGAHAFYERLGYERTGVRLAKLLFPLQTAT